MPLFFGSMAPPMVPRVDQKAVLEAETACVIFDRLRGKNKPSGFNRRIILMNPIALISPKVSWAYSVESKGCEDSSRLSTRFIQKLHSKRIPFSHVEH